LRTLCKKHVEVGARRAMPLVDFCLSGPFKSPPAVVVLGSTERKISAFAETSG
jgi:hypothetical protein